MTMQRWVQTPALFTCMGARRSEALSPVQVPSAALHGGAHRDARLYIMSPIIVAEVRN